MLHTPLPRMVTTRKAVAREARYHGGLGSAELPALADLLPSDDSSPVVADIGFRRDEFDRQVAEVELEARVELVCQRCLGSFSRVLRSHSVLGLVAGDEQARHLPPEYEPLIVGDETDLWDLVSEELALALPSVAYHPEGECNAAMLGTGGVGVEAVDAVEKQQGGAVSAGTSPAQQAQDEAVDSGSEAGTESVTETDGPPSGRRPFEMLSSLLQKQNGRHQEHEEE